MLRINQDNAYYMMMATDGPTTTTWANIYVLPFLEQMTDWLTDFQWPKNIPTNANNFGNERGHDGQQACVCAQCFAGRQARDALWTWRNICTHMPKSHFFPYIYIHQVAAPWTVWDFPTVNKARSIEKYTAATPLAKFFLGISPPWLNKIGVIF